MCVCVLSIYICDLCESECVSVCDYICMNVNVSVCGVYVCAAGGGTQKKTENFLTMLRV